MRAATCGFIGSSRMTKSASNRYPSPYLHIDARGKRTRWKG